MSVDNISHMYFIYIFLHIEIIVKLNHKEKSMKAQFYKI